MNQLSRRTFLSLGALTAVGALVGCEESTDGTFKFKHRTKKKTKTRDKNSRRRYPCGLPLRGDSSTWEYTVVTTRRYPIKINGRWTKTSKTFILCGAKAAREWRQHHPKDLVRKTAP